MNFVQDEKLKNLKLFMREDAEIAKVFYIFEKDFEGSIEPENIHKIVGTLLIHKKCKVIDFKINKYISVNYRNKGYGTLILNYIHAKILPKFDDKDEWNITINWSKENYENFVSSLVEKQMFSV